MTRPTYLTWQSLSLYYFVQVVNLKRGHHAAVILLHRRSGGHRHDPGHVRVMYMYMYCTKKEKRVHVHQCMETGTAVTNTLGYKKDCFHTLIKG